MAKPELGTKRLCPSCGAKYYDLNRNPITCPKCGTLFDIVSSSRATKASRVVQQEDEDEDEEDLVAPELVSWKRRMPRSRAISFRTWVMTTKRPSTMTPTMMSSSRTRKTKTKPFRASLSKWTTTPTAKRGSGETGTRPAAAAGIRFVSL
ncbi:TIGR02300 family protein [Pannonibacter sp. Pt2-lr]